MRPIIVIFALCGVGLGVGNGCQTAPSRPAAAGTEAQGTGGGAASAKPVAYIAGQPLAWEEVQAAFFEASGGQIIAEAVVDRAVQRRLAERGQKIEADDVERERQVLLAGLDPDADRAQRLLNELRERRGLGATRFEALLRRNAGLRKLVQDDVQVGEAAVREAYELEHGPTYEARIVVVESLQAAADLVRQAKAGESFIDLAINRSTDTSRTQGGLLPPISAADATFPSGIRSVVAKLQPGQVSDPVALDTGFAILKLERKISGNAVPYDDVKDQLTQRVRRQVERMLMQRLVRTALNEADVVVTDAALLKGWNQQRQRMLQDVQ